MGDGLIHVAAIGSGARNWTLQSSMQPIFPRNIWCDAFEAMFTNRPKMAEGSCYMVVPSDVIAKHRANWLCDEMWRLEQPASTGDTLQTSDSENDLENPDGETVRSCVDSCNLLWLSYLSFRLDFFFRELLCSRLDS